MLFLLCTDQSVKTGGDQLVAALQHRIGPSAVHGGNIHPLGRSGAVARPEAGTDEDSQASTVVGRLEAIPAETPGRLRVDQAACSGWS